MRLCIALVKKPPCSGCIASGTLVVRRFRFYQVYAGILSLTGVFIKNDSHCVLL